MVKKNKKNSDLVNFTQFHIISHNFTYFKKWEKTQNYKNLEIVDKYHEKMEL